MSTAHINWKGVAGTLTGLAIALWGIKTKDTTTILTGLGVAGLTPAPVSAAPAVPTDGARVQATIQAGGDATASDVP